MRRWHEDLALMENRVKDVRLHYGLFDDKPWKRNERYEAWSERVQVKGRWRKRKPLDCGRAKCGVCHGEKFWHGKARNTKLRKAIEFELDAEV